MACAPLSPIVFIATTALFCKWLHQRKKNEKGNYALSNDKSTETAISNKNDALILIQKRRSIFPKQYSSSKPVPRYMLEDMLEAARWAPTHHLTQPWYFIVFETESSRRDLGEFLAEQYKKACEKRGGEFIKKKYEKKLKNAIESAFVIAICVRRDGQSKDPEVEDICSVAIAVQNMHLVATEYNLGAYWSSSSLYGKNDEKNQRYVVNPEELRDFLQLPTPESFCIGWLFIGSFEGQLPQGRRAPMDSNKVLWR
jgi:nitroreductase